jgi:predicted secreted protein
MAAVSGRLLVVKKASTAIAGAKEATITVDNSPVDITSNDDSGFRTLGDFAGARSLEISMNGVITDETMETVALNTSSKLLTDITVDLPQGGGISGNFYLANFEEAGSNDADATYDITLQSSGAFTYTAAA